VRVLFHCKVPDVPGMRAVILQQRFLSGSRDQAVS
jgi:hypothetical protein